VKVIVADDSALIREGVARLLADAGHDVGTAENAEVLLREVALSSPDAVIVDIKMPPTHTDEGLEAARRIRRDQPGVGVLAPSQYLESTYAMRLIADAPSHVGYLLKDRVSDVESARCWPLWPRVARTTRSRSSSLSARRPSRHTFGRSCRSWASKSRKTTTAAYSQSSPICARLAQIVNGVPRPSTGLPERRLVGEPIRSLLSDLGLNVAVAPLVVREESSDRRT
jgi:CheY-like chemotaxis protein